MTPVIRWTLWQRRWSTLWWLIAILALVVVTLAFYPAFKDQATQLDQTITKQVPQAARAFISDTPDFLTPVGYLSSQIYYLILPMLLGILAIGLGSSLIAGEEKSGTIELLLSRPLSRSRLLLGKVIAGGLILLTATAVSFVATAIVVPLVKLPVDTLPLAATTGMCLLLAASFGAIALMVSMVSRLRSASIGVAAAIAIGGYVVTSLSSVAKWLVWPARLTPFYYYHPADMLSGHYAILDPTVLVGIIALCSVVSWSTFRRRDVGR